MLYFDSHFHFKNIKERLTNYSLPHSLIALDIGTEPNDIKERIKLRGSNKNIFLSVGAGPWELERKGFLSVKNTLEKLENDIKLYGADAIGEFGLDFFWKYGNKEDQIKLFIGQEEIANSYKKAKILHFRDADDEILNLLNYIDEKTILHCYSSGPTLAKKLIEKGAYFSFSGNITYKANENIRDALFLVPLDRILYETDAPYLAPEGKRGTINIPENAEITLSTISKIKEIKKEELKERVIENFYRVLGEQDSSVLNLF